MEMSVEAIIAIVGVIVTLPPTVLVAWKLLCRWRSMRDTIPTSNLELPRFRSLDPTPSITLGTRRVDYSGSSGFFADTAAGIDRTAGSRVVLSLQVRMDSADDWQFKRSYLEGCTASTEFAPEDSVKASLSVNSQMSVFHLRKLLSSLTLAEPVIKGEMQDGKTNFKPRPIVKEQEWQKSSGSGGNFGRGIIEKRGS
ncbi:hypothetical protein PG984_008037 [Apiospora sp. TS-2023a]